jgi:hypothetical protein
MVKDFKDKVKKIIIDLTQRSPSIFSDKLVEVAGQFDIWEADLMRTLDELKEENFIEEPYGGVIRRISIPAPAE